MNIKFVFNTSLTAVTLMVFVSCVLADKPTEFSSITLMNEKVIGAIINSEVPIEESGAYGYGVVTGAGLEGILVTTTHKGVLDSVSQTDANDGRFHNHYVALLDSKKEGSGLCPSFEISDISWDEPGNVVVNDDVVVFDGPMEFESTHSLTGDKVAFDNLGPVETVTSFTITPVDRSGDVSVDPIAAVCIDIADNAQTFIDMSEMNKP